MRDPGGCSSSGLQVRNASTKHRGGVGMSSIRGPTTPSMKPRSPVFCGPAVVLSAKAAGAAAGEGDRRLTAGEALRRVRGAILLVRCSSSMQRGGGGRAVHHARRTQRIVVLMNKTTSAPSEERSANDFVKFVHSVSFYPASTASYWNLPTNVQPASSQLPQAAASYRAAPRRHEALDGYYSAV